MYYRIAAALVILVTAIPVFAACSAAKPLVDTAAKQQYRKPMSAPVAVNFQMGADAGKITITFDTPASGVNVNVYGVDGLTVTSTAQPITAAEFAKCDAPSFDVTYVPGKGRSHLVVAVTGNFKGSVRSSTFSHAVGTRTPAQAKPLGTPMTDSDGKRIKLMPGQ